jgi:hypothetical protein
MRDGLADHGAEILGWEEAQVNEAQEEGAEPSHTTKRQGKVDAVDRYIIQGREMPPHRWRVYFLDGNKPLSQYFVHQEDLRLVKCPHLQPRRTPQCIMKERPASQD